MMATRMTVRQEPCDARWLLAQAVERFRATALAKGVKLFKQGGEPLPNIWAEPRQIVQILSNLIANAVKFTPARGNVLFTGDAAMLRVIKVKGRET